MFPHSCQMSQNGSGWQENYFISFFPGYSSWLSVCKQGCFVVTLFARLFFASQLLAYTLIWPKFCLFTKLQHNLGGQWVPVQTSCCPCCTFGSCSSSFQTLHTRCPQACCIHTQHPTVFICCTSLYSLHTSTQPDWHPHNWARIATHDCTGHIVSGLQLCSMCSVL